MLFITDNQLDAWLQEDIQDGDLTTRALGIADQQGEMCFYHRQGGCISAVSLAVRLLSRLGVNASACVTDGSTVAADTLLLRAHGNAAALHQGWKVAQNLLEWCCGVAEYLAQMRTILHHYQPEGHIACTRKIIPGSKVLALKAVLDGGGIIHRSGCGESVLLFANHRRFWPQPENWSQMIDMLRREAPEKHIIVEADNLAEAQCALQAQPDMLQLDKFTPEAARQLCQLARCIAPRCRLLLAGGINLNNIEHYAQTGISLLVTSAPYYAPPADIKVRLLPTK